MRTFAETRHFEARFSGILVPHTRASLTARVPQGWVELKTKVAWSVPGREFLTGNPAIDWAPALRNICLTFSVVTDRDPVAELSLLTQSYFDGEESFLKVKQNQAIWVCDPKWRRSLTTIINRPGDNNVNLQRLYSFLGRRIRNAYCRWVVICNSFHILCL